MDYSLVGDICSGPGAVASLTFKAQAFGTRILLLRGGSSLDKSGALSKVESNLRSQGISFHKEHIASEPSVLDIDAIVREMRDRVDAIIGIGGGSVMDAAKAIAAMITVEGKTIDYLEGVGTQAHPGTCLPWIACPTTAGTGSEGTFNAVLKGIDPGGKPFKKSLRHRAFLPRSIILDPDLLASSDPRKALPRALDALSQLLEAATSAKATPLSDAFVFEGLRLMGSRIDQVLNASIPVDGWLDLQFAAFFSGIGIAHAGLGLVHGIAGTLGAQYPIPHGIACGILLAPAFRVTLDALRRDAESRDSGRPALEGLKRMARAGDLFSVKDHRITDSLGKTDLPKIIAKAEGLLSRLEEICAASGLGKLSRYGIDSAAIGSIADTSSGRDSLATLGSSDALSALEVSLS